MSKNYDRKEILARLSRLGIKPKYSKRTQKLIHLVASSKTQIGIKIWGMIDFLGLPLIKK